MYKFDKMIEKYEQELEAIQSKIVSRDMSYDDGMSGRYSYRGYPSDYGYGNGMPPRW